MILCKLDFFSKMLTFIYFQIEYVSGLDLTYLRPVHTHINVHHKNFSVQINVGKKKKSMAEGLNECKCTLCQWVALL